MNMTIHLSTQDLQRAIKELRAYRNGLQAKCSTFVARLADEGISVGQSRTGKYASNIVFRKELKDSKYGATAIMIGSSDPLRVEWYVDNDGNTTGYDIIPILMAEFGSGWRAVDNTGEGYTDKANAFGGGQGKHPDQKHAFDEDGWYYKSVEDGEWHHSKGYRPTYPMFTAALSMRVAIRRIAREVFGT